MGFRTEITLKNDEAWDFANRECGKFYLFFGGLELLTSLVVLMITYDGFDTINEIIIPLSYVVLSIITLILTTVIVKRKVDQLEIK